MYNFQKRFRHWLSSKSYTVYTFKRYYYSFVRGVPSEFTQSDTFHFQWKIIEPLEIFCFFETFARLNANYFGKYKFFIKSILKKKSVLNKLVFNTTRIQDFYRAHSSDTFVSLILWDIAEPDLTKLIPKYRYKFWVSRSTFIILILKEQ